MPLRRMGRRIHEGSTLAELVRIITDEAAGLFGTAGAWLELSGPDGRPRCAADSCDWMSDDAVRTYGGFAYRTDPLLARVLETHAPAGLQDVMSSPISQGPWSAIGPVVGGGTLAGALRLFRPARFPRRLIADLWVVSAHLSVTIARLDLAGPPRPRLTPRQAQVAELTRAGYTNREMSDALGISVPAIKKHLAHLYERLEVSNRTELAARTAHLSSRDDAAPGIRVTRFG